MTASNTEKKSFLRKVAEDVRLISNGDIPDLRLIFTNRRAIKYFVKEYEALCEEVCWLPGCETIDDFVRNCSPYKKAEELSLIYVLYLCYQKIYYSHNPLPEGAEAESFESFYFWGKTILSDFDDVDKNLADAEKLYTTLSEEKEIEEMFDFLDAQQKTVLLQYFEDFKKLYSTDSDLKNNFVKIWNCLFEIYSDYRKTLAEKSIAYGGMMYRDVLERLLRNEISFEGKTFAFVGFNVLNRSEKEIFKAIRNTNTVYFYWDYDTYYTGNKDNEAGLFMRQNIKEFPCKESFAENDFSQIEKTDCKFNIISTTYESSQTLYIRQWIENLERVYGDTLKQNQIAIILHNENLLPFVLKALPDNINNEATKVNITMGYPFKFSNLYNDIAEFLNAESEKEGNCMQQLDSLADFLKRKGKEPDCDNEIKEAAFRSINLLQDFKHTLVFIGNELPKNFVRKTLLRLLQKQSMPFESDATDGIQIMGLLESRNLDFKHILMLSTTNGNIPSADNVVTFIPHSLRKIFNLTTSERKVAVIAYYFYRLLQNAETMDFVYNMVSMNKDREEMSCFLQQLRVELGKPIRLKTLNFTQGKEILKIDLPSKRQETIEEIINTKSNVDDKSSYLSPSYLTTYIDCPLEFYYQNICRLKVLEQEEDKIPLVFGTLFHNSAQLLEESKHDKTPQVCVMEAFDAMGEEKGLLKEVHKSMITSYLQDLSEYDKKNTGRQFYAAEKEVSKEININGRTLRLGGRIDRIDISDGEMVLCDYKTGGSDEDYKGVESLFQSGRYGRAKYLFQIMFYAWLLWRGKTIKVEIIYVHKLKYNQYNSKSYLYDSELHEKFDRMMREKLEEFLSVREASVWETAESDEDCKYCNYKDLCPRKQKMNSDDTI